MECSKLNVDVLYNLSPYDSKGRDRAQEAARLLLLNTLKMEPNVHEIFFHDTKANPFLKDVDRGIFPLSGLATALIAEVLCKSKDEFRFCSTIKKTELFKYLSGSYSGVAWKKLGFSLYAIVYPQVVKHESLGVCFKDFMDSNGKKWASRLFELITEPEWTLTIVKRIITGKCTEEQYNQEMNDIFVKLHLLDPYKVLPTYHYLLQQKALPQVNLELVTRNYLGSPLDWLLIKDDVIRAINKPSSFNSSRLSLDLNDIFYGVTVDEFVVTECRNIGVWNGKRPQNRKMPRLKDRCKLM